MEPHKQNAWYRRRRLVIHLRVPSMLVGLVSLLALGFAGCGLTSTPVSGGGQIIQVVAAENFWGSIASQVGGGRVEVTSILTNPSADPHSYEPTAQDARTVARAQFVIVNGAGYDAWADQLVQASPVSGRKELNVADLLGKHNGDNPHMWYNPEYVTAVANAIRDDLKSLDPADAAVFDREDQTFLTHGLQQYHSLIQAIKTRYGGTPVGATESIFSYLAPALGLDLITPYSYLKAVSEGTDISAADQATVEQQITGKHIKILVYNSQNTPNNIQTLIKLAQANGIPVATITETLVPATATFQDWQSKQLEGIEAALAQAT
jgi:zinc/manganese transport system substrate-binding protein